ncbi:tRNA and rRNA cytosine-C5-methylase, variant 1 [Capsaspora owczarzaki ATCC 30864]|uniref:tRNA and rRNA cytosine-C5-methylase, variant 1 n=1 Tax=Capsaspora owczarzaki (strain ATCC 30864) TaxID=595528 RepID=A0A0D2X1L3_CAPO3|nr:tRNA and rRNA cytosine-C5-methylase, variant 1 [Capsaspora owczarzaki ATCC 30864]
MAGNRWPKHKSRSNAPPQQQHVQPQSQGQVQPQPQGQGQEQQQTFTNVYFAAASVIDRLRDKRGSLKSLAFACAFHDKKRLFALICEALKYRTVVEELLQVSGFTKKNKEIAPSVALVAVYDLLIGRGSIECGGVIKRAVTESKGDLNAALVRMKIRAKVKDVRDLLPAAIREQDAIVIPRYVRVNTLKMSVAAAVQALQQQPGGFALVDRPADISALSGRSFCQDEHLKDLLVFPSGTDFHDHKLYTSGVLILQDKASCFPAHVLSPSIGESVIDGCAAPGNKTSHVAALVGLKGHVHAFDLDPRRFKTMQNAMRKFGASNVECMNGNFLEIKPTDPKYAKVSAILLDPSCSGSGIVNRLDYLAADDDENESEATETQEQRLTALSDFQFQTVSHAMTCESPLLPVKTNLLV